MNTVLLDFNTRAQEVDGYFIFLESLIKQTTQLAVLDNTGTYKIQSLDSELAKTLKANGFLLLYNLVESTMRNAIEAIFDELRSNGVSFNHVRPEIKKIVIQNLKARSPDNIHLKMKDISIDIITAGFKPKEIFAGNVDRDEITDTARKYGFSFDTEYAKTKHGKRLVDVKDKRNDLAHGNKSFAEVGRNSTIEDLLEIKEEVVEYLRQILKNIEVYLDSKEYLDSSTSTP